MLKQQIMSPYLHKSPSSGKKAAGISGTDQDQLNPLEELKDLQTPSCE